MAITSTSTSITTADSAVSSQSVVVNTGSGLTSYAGGAGAAVIVQAAAGPTISNVIYTDASFVNTAANAANTAGGNIKVIGTGFEPNSKLYLAGNLITANTYVSSTEYRATLPATAVGTYTFNLFAPSNVGSIWTTGIQFQAPPVWSAYSTIVSSPSVSYQLAATGATSYAVTAGSLPAGLSLSSGGLLSGTYSGSDGTTTFTVTATNAYGQATAQVVSFQYASSYTAQYLVVAGGGGGGIDGYGSGGGAGGMLTGSATFSAGMQYTVTVGAGGTGYPYSVSGAGTNSVLSGPAPSGFSTVTSIGGGSGTGSGGGGVAPTRSGGSGGGGGYPGQPAGAGTPGQGFPGGSISFSFQAGGGGGAGEAGKSSGSQGTGGNGGNGLTWTYTGATYYAGGGGAASDISWSPFPAYSTQYGGGGGLGGGGSGRGKNNPSYPIAATPGTANRGGGGGGGGNPGFGAGGSGVVILAVPNAAYPTVSAPGASVSTPPAAPGLTVLTYNSSGTFTG